MSVRPWTFNADGSIGVVYDEMGHMGTISADQIRWTQGMDGSDNHNFIRLDCPDGCGSSSTHPVGGGADAPRVQEMFVRKIHAEGCCCAMVQAKSSQQAIDHVKELVTAMDGEERWQVDEEQLLGALA